MKLENSAGSSLPDGNETPESRGVFPMLLAMIQQNFTAGPVDEERGTVALQLTVLGQPL
ncbi:hypothetical protein ACIPY1_19240 [Paenarthrobacter nicotinovorans]|uniref:hypothetical protein n=1 Tax=Paenarthrobacter nicotinovorans TaxID=29320 RepID=UPI0037F210AE